MAMSVFCKQSRIKLIKRKTTNNKFIKCMYGMTLGVGVLGLGLSLDVVFICISCPFEV